MHCLIALPFWPLPLEDSLWLFVLSALAALGIVLPADLVAVETGFSAEPAVNDGSGLLFWLRRMT